jgi:hypothetical protein
VLFSEPKIPQRNEHIYFLTRTRRFSALQRAENSSNSWDTVDYEANFGAVSVLFSEPKIPHPSAFTISGADRCSSAILNFAHSVARERLVYGFSALQRAENSSPSLAALHARLHAARFSALQRAENSSRAGSDYDSA